MPNGSSILTIGTFVSAFLGAALSVLCDRFWRRVESRALFRIQVGAYEDQSGRGTSLTITNVGLDPVPEYSVRLFHPDRGSLGVFHSEPRRLVFPQYPDQENGFRCQTSTAAGIDGCATPGLKDWFLRVRDKQVAAPSFVGFELRLVMRNSELVLFQDEGLGNHVAKGLYEDSIGARVEQQVKPVFYRSKAPFRVEMIRRYKIRRMIRQAEKEGTGRP